MTTGSLLEHWRGTQEGGHLATLAQRELTLPKEAIEQEFLDALTRLTEQALETRDAYGELSRPSDLSLAQKEALRRQFRIKALKDKERAQTISDAERDELKKLRHEADH